MAASPPDSAPSTDHAPAPLDAAQYDADGRLRPSFVLSFPDDPELNNLVATFERGDFRKVRADAPRLLKTATDARVRQAVMDLRKRIDPDPQLLVFLTVAVTLLAFLGTWLYW